MLKRGKAQGAMEFLMTYGWAILAAVIAIGVLAYFGVFSPGKYAPSAAVVNPPFYIDAWNAKASTGVTLEIKNNGAETYNVTSVVITGCGTYSTPVSIASSESEVITQQCTPALVAGANFKADPIVITYRKAGSAVDLTSTGSAAGKVVA